MHCVQTASGKVCKALPTTLKQMSQFATLYVPQLSVTTLRKFSHAG